MTVHPDSPLVTAQLRLMADRLRSGGRLLSAKEQSWAFSEEELGLLKRNVVLERQSIRTKGASLYSCEGEAREYWDLASKAKRLTGRLGPAPPLGKPKARSRWKAREKLAKKAQERASEVWSTLPRNQQAMFEEPPEGGWPPDRLVWCDMEWPLPLPRHDESARQPARDILREQQIAALEQRLAINRIETLAPPSVLLRRWLGGTARARLFDD